MKHQNYKHFTEVIFAATYEIVFVLLTIAVINDYLLFYLNTLKYAN